MHPYKNLPAERFWKTSVSDRNFLDLERVYTKKFVIERTDRIVTAGSCFAQHIAKRLKASGFNFMDYEQPPPGLPEDDEKKLGFGLFSARYANIYTVRQLLQLYSRAFEGFSPAEDMWYESGRYFDPFRPGVEPDGFASEEEFRASRLTHMSSVRKVFENSDVFIFTLGLTEAWRSSIDGAVFPMCPGTIRGTFSSNRHEFHNFSYPETLADLELLLNKARSINPTLRFILTVSPVPLAATAENAHVMVATSYSKSVLRAVAGDLAIRHEFVDYFPSFELVAGPAIRGALFEPDMRNVSSRGVDIVMRHFFEQHALAGEVDEPLPLKKRWQKKKARARHIDDIICEEGSLDQFSR